jgi:erythromycin esterase
VTTRFIAAALVVLLLAPAGAQDGNPAWVAWARANHYPIASIQTLEGDSFNDLQFFKAILANRRLVQLGESGHGVAEFSHAKVRLIKFLHQQMGFDVIAFESGLFECYNANHGGGTALATMRNCIFGVWHTEEVRPLFEYIEETQETPRPLILAGFDTQTSSSFGVTPRPAFLAGLVSAIDPARAIVVQATDFEHVQGLYGGGSREAYARTHQARLTEFYGGLELFFRHHRARLEEVFGPEPPRVGEQTAFSMLRYMEQLRAGTTPTPDRYEGAGAIRDFGMANNLTFLANELYPDRKIMAWAHNGHIRHDNAGEHERALPTMGQWIRERFRDQLYTIGLYMDRGSAAQNNRVVYSINPAPANSMEWVMANAGSPTLFIDFLHQRRVEGNSWMFERTQQREWGMDPGFPIVPRNQYDGILFIDAVGAPSYITAF